MIKYQGNFNQGKRHGQGCLYFKSGAIYEGSWLNDQRTGYGTYKYPPEEGGYFEGYWVNGLKHGYGTEVYPDGRRVSGEFENDKIRVVE